MRWIIINTQFAALHRYVNAPEGVEYLRYPHRHVFHVKVEIEVFHDDRELEFILVKQAIDKFIHEHILAMIEHRENKASCEMIAEWIQDWVRYSYPIPGHTAGSRARYVTVEVMEDGENGARIEDGEPVLDHRPFTDRAEGLTGVAAPTKQLRVGVDVDFDTSAMDRALDRLQKRLDQIKPAMGALEPPGIRKYVEDVLSLDQKFGLDGVADLTTDNLMFYANALAGEVGELCNLVKKIVRDGETPQRWKELDFEAVDIMIYLVKFILMTNTDFDAAWDEKHQELIGRYTDGKKHLSYAGRKLVREDEV